MQDSGMFLTQRENKTAFSSHRHRIIKNPINRTLDLSQKITDRPFTTSLGRTQPLLSYRNLQDAESQMCKTFRQDMSSYVRQKFKSLAEKHKQTIISEKSFQEDFNLTKITNPESKKKLQRSQPHNIHLMRVCGLSYGSPLKIETVLGEAYLVNAKEKLSRILSRKKQVEEQYKSINKKVKQKQKESLRIRKERDRRFMNPEHVANIEWDSQWRKSQEKQTRRYKFRLENKHRRQSSSLTIQW